MESLGDILSNLEPEVEDAEEGRPSLQNPSRHTHLTNTGRNVHALLSAYPFYESRLR